MEQLVLSLLPPPEPTLDNFLPGRNGAALAALRALLDGRERMVYLWGGAGAGKSHLMQGTLAAAQAANLESCNVALKFDGRNLNSVRVLCVDGVDHLSDDDQSTLFDFHNLARAGGAAIAAAGNQPPADLKLREDLRTRLASGVVLQVHPLSDAEKRAALESRARERGFQLKQDVADYLLTHHARDMRSLMAILIALDEYSLREKRAITLPLLREALLNHG